MSNQKYVLAYRPIGSASAVPVLVDDFYYSDYMEADTMAGAMNKGELRLHFFVTDAPNIKAYCVGGKKDGCVIDVPIDTFFIEDKRLRPEYYRQERELSIDPNSKPGQKLIAEYSELIGVYRRTIFDSERGYWYFVFEEAKNYGIQTSSIAQG